MGIINEFSKASVLTKIAVAAGSLLAFKILSQAGDVATVVKETATAINPVNENNIINRGVSAVIRDNTGQKNLGAFLFCLFNPDKPTCRKEEPLTRSQVKQAVYNRGKS